MTYRNERWLDHIGLNLIRIVIGSYFMAIALGLIKGVDQTALFAPTLDHQIADFIGTTILFTVAVAFMTGMYLRMSALILALFVLCSSLVENFMNFAPGHVSFFWRDLTLVCGVLLSYSSLKRRDLRKASLIMRQPTRTSKLDKDGITPRRVSVQAKPTRRPRKDPDYNRVLRPLIAPTHPLPGTDIPLRDGRPPMQDETARTSRGGMPVVLPDLKLARRELLDADDECTNIFADV